MGKYINKSKITGDVGVMEVSQPTSLGVRNRAAKTLALQRLNSSFASAAASLPANPDGVVISGASSCYLQLRSRRLEKPPLLTEPKKQQQQQQQQRHQGSEVGGFKESSSRSRAGSVKAGSSVSGLVPVGRSCDGDGCFGNYGSIAGYAGESVNNDFPGTEEGKEASAEASLGENNLDFETRDRSSRESTPCNIVGDLHTIVTPGSSTRQRSAVGTNYRSRQNNSQRIVPTTRELEEFFVYAEQQQQRLFMEKYNFDVVNDSPLPGRYEWVQVVP